MRRFSAPELPDDEADPPAAEPYGERVPPRRRPPTAVGLRPRPRPPASPSYYGRRLTQTERMARGTMAALLAMAAGAGQYLSPGDALVWWAGAGALLCAWNAATGEGPARTLKRRLRWLRLRLYGRFERTSERPA